jgi:hypothetical protein
VKPDKVKLAEPKLAVPELEGRISYSLIECSARTGIKLCRLRQAIRARELPARLAGKRHIVLVDDLKKFVLQLPLV